MHYVVLGDKDVFITSYLYTVCMYLYYIKHNKHFLYCMIIMLYYEANKCFIQ